MPLDGSMFTRAPHSVFVAILRAIFHRSKIPNGMKVLRRARKLITLLLVLSTPLLPSLGQDQSKASPSSLDLLSSPARQSNFVADLRIISPTLPSNLVSNAAFRTLIMDPSTYTPSSVSIEGTYGDVLRRPSDSCLLPIQIELLSSCFTLDLTKFTSSADKIEFYPIKPIQPAPRPAERFHWKSALLQSFEFLLVEHAVRIAQDDAIRYQLMHKPFWHDYLASAGQFHMSHWGDGDSFIVNYIGHPMEGAVSGYIYLNNDPRGRSVRFGKSSTYWHSRLRAMAWAAVYSAYFEIGPIFSEAAIGNEGGYTYVPGCGMYPCTRYPGKDFKPPTNNTGWVDFVVTPTVGLGWIILEDAIETQIVDRLADGSPALKFKILRGALSPSHTFANMFAGKAPWFRYPTEGSPKKFFGTSLLPAERFPWKDEPRFSTGIQFISMNFPLDREGCSSCKQFSPGVGLDFSYRVAKYVFVNSVVNLFPGSGSFGEHGASQEMLAGIKLGHTGRSWGLFSDLRGGTVHYDKVLVPGSSTAYESRFRFAIDLGGTVEYYASRNSTLRFNAGTTLIHYLQEYPDPKQPPTSVMSAQYYSFRGSPYMASGYVFRF
jgi:hypothetical protein